MVLVARGDERNPAGDVDIPQAQQIWTCTANLAAGGCAEIFVALGERVIPAPATTSTTLYLPEWYHSLDKTSQSALMFVDRHPVMSGVVVLTADSITSGACAVARVIEAADGDPEAICRAEYGGTPLQPIYLGAERIREAIAEIDAGTPVFRYLLAHAGDMVRVDCSDLGDAAPIGL